jgi:predicted metalloprotease
MQQRHRKRDRWNRSITAALCGAFSALLVASCGSPTVLEGRALSMLWDPNRVGGLPATDGPSGPRPNAPQPTGTVQNTDNGQIDHLALLAISDIEDFWQQNYSESLQGTFTPISTLVSYDSKSPKSPQLCGAQTYRMVNAFYCPPKDLMAWDRGSLIPGAMKYFGDVSVNAVLAHEYGHALQNMAKLVGPTTPGLVAEQQADCFSGTYVRWVAEGKSPRFTLNTTDGLDHVLAGAIDLRDPIMTVEDVSSDPHGSALDRVSAFQIGFDTGAAGCSEIDMNEINQRRGDLPTSLQVDPEGNVDTGESPINDDTLSTLTELLETIFSPANPPTLSTDAANCPDAQLSKPASYCPATNTISVDMPALQQMGAPADESELVLLQGDNTALSVVTSRYMLALQHERNLPLDTPAGALRTACLTGVAQSKMAEPVDLPSGKSLVLSAGDVDEAISGLLTNGLVASDTNGKSVPAGFTRILAYRSGLVGDADGCYQRFP